MSRTVVIQSYAPGPLAPWLRQCVNSVEAWTRDHGWEYRYVDDRILEVVPAWYRERCGVKKLPVTDLGRLLLMQEALEEPDVSRTLWLDSDVLIFDPAALRIEDIGEYGFCREFWIWREPDGRMHGSWAVNNAVMLMSRGSPALGFYIHACEAIVGATQADALQHNAVGTRFLTALSNAMPLPVVPRAALFCPSIVADIAAGESAFLRVFGQNVKEHAACANLCGSLIGRSIWGVTLDERQLGTAVARLLETRGGVVNGHIGP